jgi:acetyl-CoA carboxylase biotin carboxyl carrier protein
MKRTHVDGRLFVPELVARSHAEGPSAPSGDELERAGKRVSGEIVLASPAVGSWRDAPPPGTLVTPGMPLGQLEILGVLHRLRAPDDAVGVVMERPGPRLARQPVAYDDVLVRLDPSASPSAAGHAAAASAPGADAQGLSFLSPLSGRFYARSSPDQPAFVKPGDVIEAGRTVALLEVMKTFNRIAYGGEGLPARARVLAVVPVDESDVDEGDVLLKVEPA